MFLSKVALGNRHDPYQWHRLLWKLFDVEPDARRPFLFRCERLVHGGVEVLAQSFIEPSSRAPNAMVIACKPFEPQPTKDQVLRFRLAANPVKTIADENGRKDAKGRVKSCRVPIVREEDQFAWLARKLEDAAELVEARVNARQPLHFRKANRAGKITRVTFEGVLSVKRPDQLNGLITGGIGPAKAFGCGLLSVARKA